MPTLDPTLRVAMYSHDTFGLGHITRTLRLARAVVDAVPSASVLILTGSPIANRLTFPPRVEYVKLPSVRKDGPESYAARDLGIPFWRVRHLRTQILRDSVRIFRPHLLFVDNVPLGMKQEMLPSLEIMSSRRRSGARIHLNLRDILDDPQVVRTTWCANGAAEALTSFYDEIHVFGDPGVHDAIGAYDLPPRVTSYLGYLAPVTRPGVQIQDGSAEWSRGLPRVLVTIGGGDDGTENLRAAVAAYRVGPPAYSLDVVLGPLIDRREREALLQEIRPGDAVRVREYVPDLADSIGSYHAVLSMGGYNTLCEVMARARRSIVIPRIHPRREQEIRATALADRRVLRAVDPRSCSPERLDAEIRTCLREGPILPSSHSPPLDGLRRFQARVVKLASDVLPRRAAPTPAAARRARSQTTGAIRGILLLLGLLIAWPSRSFARDLRPSEVRVELLGGHDSNILNASDKEVRDFETRDSSSFFVVHHLRDAAALVNAQAQWPLSFMGRAADVRLQYGRLQYPREPIRAENRYQARLRTRLGPQTTASATLGLAPDIYGRHRLDKDARPGDPLFRAEIRTDWDGAFVVESEVRPGVLSRVGAEVSYRDYNHPFDERDRWRVGGVAGVSWLSPDRVRLELGGGYRRARTRNVPDLGSDPSNLEWALRSAVECDRCLGGDARLRAQLRRSWTHYTSTLPNDLNHFGREDADWEIATSVQQPVTPAIDWRASLVFAWRAARPLVSTDLTDDDGAFHDTFFTTGFAWNWKR